MSNFSLELHVTPKNKDGKWGKRVKSRTVAGFNTLEDAKSSILSNAKHLCKLTKQDTDTFFVEALLLRNGKYIDCDNSVVMYHSATDALEPVA